MRVVFRVRCTEGRRVVGWLDGRDVVVGLQLGMADGLDVGSIVGFRVGLRVGRVAGSELGFRVGEIEGDFERFDGLGVSNALGLADGSDDDDGLDVGTALGKALGLADGFDDDDGLDVGTALGKALGLADGFNVDVVGMGEVAGSVVGFRVGVSVGVNDGFEVVGDLVGFLDGLDIDGIDVGGLVVGTGVGLNRVGEDDGDLMPSGLSVGVLDGVSDGAGIPTIFNIKFLKRLKSIDPRPDAGSHPGVAEKP